MKMSHIQERGNQTRCVKIGACRPCKFGSGYLFCKGADSSIFPRVIEGKVDQIRSRVERNAVVRRWEFGGAPRASSPVAVGGMLGGRRAHCGGPSRIPSSGAPPPQPSVGVWWLEGGALRPE